MHKGLLHLPTCDNKHNRRCLVQYLCQRILFLARIVLFELQNRSNCDTQLYKSLSISLPALLWQLCLMCSSDSSDNRCQRKRCNNFKYSRTSVSAMLKWFSSWYCFFLLSTTKLHSHSGCGQYVLFFAGCIKHLIFCNDKYWLQACVSYMPERMS